MSAQTAPSAAPPLLPPLDLPRAAVVIPTVDYDSYAGASPLGLQVGPRVMVGLRGRPNGPEPGPAFALDLGLAATYGRLHGDVPWLLRLELGYSLNAPTLEHLLVVGPSAAIARVSNSWSTAWIFSFGPRFVVGSVLDQRGLGVRSGAAVEFESFNGDRSSGLFIAADVSHQALFVGSEVLQDLRIGLGTGMTFGSGTKK